MSSVSAVTRAAAEAAAPTQIPMLIGGQWRAASETYEVRDPYRDTVFEIAPRSTLAELDDALTAAVEMLLAIEERARRHPNLVATVGKLEVPRSAPNTIPGRVRFTLDIRSPGDAERVKAVEDIKTTLAAIAARRGVTQRLTPGHQARAAHCDEKLSDLLAAAAESCGAAPRRIPSGAGHDAMAFDKVIPFAMLFVRCRGGVSHNPDEYASAADIDIASRVLSNFLDRIGS